MVSRDNRGGEDKLENNVATLQHASSVGILLENREHN